MNWIENYKALRSAIGIEFPGYITHEAVAWSPIKKRWYFLPRKCSNEQFNKVKVSECDFIHSFLEEYTVFFIV